MSVQNRFRKMTAEEIKSKYAAMSSATKGKDNFFSPELGTYIIRLLPSVSTETVEPYAVVVNHTNMGENRDKKDIICPKDTYGTPCPICDKRYELYKSNNEAMSIVAKSLATKFKGYWNIVVKGYTKDVAPSIDVKALIADESQYKVKILGAHWGLHEDLLRIYLNPDNFFPVNGQPCDVTDIAGGADIKYTVFEEKGYRNHVVEVLNSKFTNGQAEILRGAVCKDAKILERISTEAFDLNKMFKSKPALPYAELQTLLERTLSIGTPVPSAPSAPVPHQAPASPANYAATPLSPGLHVGKLPCFKSGKYKAEDPMCSMCADKVECSA